MFDQLSAEILASLIKGFPTTTTTTTTRTTTTKQNVDPAVYYVYSRVKIDFTSGDTEKITSGGSRNDFCENNF
jgi:hypothetical protein